jgi:hypothetical protein
MGISIERELNDLEKGITALRVDYERFFGGELKAPPVQPRRALEATLRRLGNADVEKAAERFRLQSLQSRFNSFAELWEKRLQLKEEGRTGPVRRLARTAPAAPVEPNKGRPAAAAAGPADVAALLAAAEAAVVRTTPSPVPAPSRDATAVPSVKPKSRVDFTPLFRRYVEARQALGEDVSRMKYEKFEEAVKRQAEEIRRKTGSSRLVFEVQTTDGRVRLVGRPAAPGSKG